MIKILLLAAVMAAPLCQAAQWEVYAGAPLPAQANKLVAPRGAVVAQDDTIYFTDGAAVRMLRPDGSLHTVAGDPLRGGSRDGPAAQARFEAPSGLALGADGTLYVADTGNHTVRAISRAGAVTTLAGRAGMPGKADGKGGAARFNQPSGLAFDRRGGLLVADPGNGLLRRVDLAGTVGSVTTLALRLPFRPQGIAVDARGALVLNDAQRAVRVDGNGQALPLDDWLDSGQSQQEGMEACLRNKCLRRYLTVSVPVTTGTVDAPAVGLAADRHGRLVGVSPAAATLYRIGQDGVIVPLAGQGDVTGAISGVAASPQGQLTVLLERAGYAARWDSAGLQQPFSLAYATSLNRDGPAREARFSDITRMAVGRDGGLYVLDGDQLRRIDKDGTVKTLREEGGFRKIGESPAAQVDLHGSLVARPSTGVFVTANGALAGVSAEGDIGFVSGPPGMLPDATGWTAALHRMFAAATSQAEPFVLPGLGRHSIAADASGQAFYCADNVLWRIRPRGVARKTVLQGKDGCGDVVVAPNDDVLMLHGHYITRVGSDGHQMLAAGHRERKGRQDGVVLQARFRRITAAVADAGSNLFLVDDGVVRKLSHDGSVSTEVGIEGGPQGSRMNMPAGAGKLLSVAVDRKGALFVANRRGILRVAPANRR